MFLLLLDQQFHTVCGCGEKNCCWKTLWMPAGRSLKESLCSFVTWCWDKGSFSHISPCWSPIGSDDPFWPETVITQSVLLADSSTMIDCTVLLSPHWVCCCFFFFFFSFQGCGSPMFWSVFLCSSDPVICLHSPSWKPLLCMWALSSSMSSHSQHCLWACCVEVSLRDKTLIRVWWHRGRWWGEWRQHE